MPTRESLHRGDYIVRLLTEQAPEWLAHDSPEDLIGAVNCMSGETLYSALKRGRMLQFLRDEYGMDYWNCAEKGLTPSKSEYHHLLHLVSPESVSRLLRTDWQQPKLYTVYRDLSYWNEHEFDGVKDWITGHTSNRQLWKMRALYYAKLRPKDNDPDFGRLPPDWLDQVVAGDAFDLIQCLPPCSIDAIITSPPYADAKMFGHVVSPTAAEYPQWYVRFLAAAERVLKPHGSVLSVVNSTVQNGAWVNYIERTIIAAEDAGWQRPDKLDWFKPDGTPQGSTDRGRGSSEYILWHTKSENPYNDWKASGHLSDNIGFVSSNRRGLSQGESERTTGTARHSSIFVAAMGQIDRGVDYPAKFPRKLVKELLLTFCPLDGVVCDPFAGSGTTGLTARSLGCHFVMFDKNPEAVAIMRRRLESETNVSNRDTP